MKFKYFNILLGLFAAVLLISNVVAVKIFQIGPFSFAGSVILFLFVYIFGDIVTEVYNYSRSKFIFRS